MALTRRTLLKRLAMLPAVIPAVALARQWPEDEVSAGFQWGQSIIDLPMVQIAQRDINQWTNARIAEQRRVTLGNYYDEVPLP